MPIGLTCPAKNQVAHDLVEVEVKHGYRQWVSLSELENSKEFPTLIPLRNQDGTVIGHKIGLLFHVYRRHLRKVIPFT
jgi:hypothetical protein